MLFYVVLKQKNDTVWARLCGASQCFTLSKSSSLEPGYIVRFVHREAKPTHTKYVSRLVKTMAYLICVLLARPIHVKKVYPSWCVITI